MVFVKNFWTWTLLIYQKLKAALLLSNGLQPQPCGLKQKVTYDNLQKWGSEVRLQRSPKATFHLFKRKVGIWQPLMWFLATFLSGLQRSCAWKKGRNWVSSPELVAVTLICCLTDSAHSPSMCVCSFYSLCEPLLPLMLPPLFLISLHLPKQSLLHCRSVQWPTLLLGSKCLFLSVFSNPGI